MEKLVEFRGLKVREGTYDAYVIKEQEPTYGHLDYTGATVMDIGANIGASADMFYRKGAKKVICYEPLEDNALICKMNVPQAELVVAAVGKEAGVADIFVAPNRKNYGNTSLKIQRGRENEGGVPVVSFLDEVKRVKPTIIKIDCEGGEFDFLPCKLPAHVKGVTMELHRGQKAWREVGIPAILKMFEDWELVHATNMDGDQWTGLRTWRR